MPPKNFCPFLGTTILCPPSGGQDMSLIGQGVLAIWNDIAPEGGVAARENFIEWHGREHVAERLAIEGFLRCRRYVAIHGAPEHFTLYETTDLEVLTGPV